MREHGRGKRWLLLRRWKTVRGSKRAELQALFAANRRLFKAYVLREQLDRLWTYKTRPGVLAFLMGWFKALRWQRLPEMERLGDFLLSHINGIAAYCDHDVPSASSNRSTPPSRPSCDGRVACETKRCCS
jgi:transposase